MHSQYAVVAPSFNDYWQILTLKNVEKTAEHSKFTPKGTKMDLYNLVEYYQEEEIRTTQTGAKVLNDLMIPGTTSINQ